MTLRLPVLTCLVAAAAPVWAETDTPPAQLETVVVTAERKTDNLQNAPISLAVLDAERLARDGVTNLLDIKESVPSLSIEPFPTDNANLKLFLRGIGIIDTQVTQDAPVAVYLDDIYLARATGLATELAELERIEVLRGPQGTLYGRNSTGGTVNLVTRKPTLGEYRFRHNHTVGSRHLQHFRSVVNLPMGETAAAQLSYLSSGQHGFVENTGPGEDFGDRQARGWRLATLWDVNDQIALSYAFERIDHDYVNMTYQPVRPKEWENTSDFTLFATQYSVLLVDDDIPYRDDDEINTRMSTVAPMQESYVDVNFHRFGLNYTPGNYTVRYIAGMRDMDSMSWSDLGSGSTNSDYRLDGGDYTSPDGRWTLEGEGLEVLSLQRTHELQFISDAFDQQLEYRLGAYYFEESGGEFSEPLHHQFSTPITPRLGAASPNGANVGLVSLVSERFEIENRAVALYGRMTYTPDWLDRRGSLTLGYRHSEDERYAYKKRRNPAYVSVRVDDPVSGDTVRNTLVPASSEDFDADNRKDFRDNSAEIIMQWQQSDALSYYGKVAEAYKSGGFNMRDPEESFFVRGFDEEKATVYELGLRSEWWDHRLRVNATAFQTYIDDMQINFTLPRFSDTRAYNAGEARTRGGELDLTVVATRDLHLTASYAYLEAEMLEIIDPETGEDVTDDYIFPAAPRNMSNLGIEWSFWRGDVGVARLHLGYAYMDERNGGAKAEGVDNTRLDPYELYNARVGLYDVNLWGGTLDVSLWSKNIKDTVYVVNAIDQLPQASRAVYFGEPRTSGVDVRLHF